MLILFAVISGCFIGSFLGVVVDRFRTKQSIVFGRSHCEQCQTVLRVFDLIPVVSFVWLRGKCRTCCAPLSFRYPLMECLTGILFGLTVWRYSVPALLPIGFLAAHMGVFMVRDLLFVCLLILLLVIDARHGVLPDSLTLPGIAIFTGFNLWLGIPWMTLLVGSLVLGGFFLAQYLISRGTWVGDGDIRFGLLLGVMFGLAQGALALMFAYVIGAIVGVLMLWQKKAGLKTALPFGPFLAIAGWIMLLFGPYLSRIFFVF